ncbi:MAG: hypothetical protein K8F25_07465 [Fimbriimonadaceae bacterium]|nr:hypothetical protein [Alphaproteobacteria bacterium]
MFIRSMSILCGVLFLMLLAGAYGVSQSAFAQSGDPHQLYETKCAGCHEAHAGEFVRSHLERNGDNLAGRKTGMDLRAFLERGHGKLATQEIETIVMHFTAIFESGAIFQEKCLICHDRAVILARRQLIFKDGRLVGRYSGRDVETFLQHHGRLERAEITALVQILKRQLISQPAP